MDLRAQYQQIKPEVDSAVARVFDSQYFILSPEVQAFEEQIAKYVGVKFAVGCASGTDALLLSLLALGVGPSDEVITVPFTFVASAGPIALLGARPVFVDIDPTTFNMDVNKIDAAVTKKTKAIITVDLFGLMADTVSVNRAAQKHGIQVIEDAAQAIGAKHDGAMAGSTTAMGCFSFFPSKNLGAAGDGGLVTTNDPQINERLRKLRVHGSPRRYEYEIIGVNSRLDSIQAAVLAVKLKHLEKWAEGRRQNAKKYEALFKEYKLQDQVVLPKEPAGYHHIFNQYTIRCQKRDELRKFLAEKEIPTEIYYPFPLHLQKAFAYLGYKAGDFPETKRACREVLSLPIYPELPEGNLRLVVEAISHFYSN